MWTLGNLMLALKIRSLIRKWIVKAWWQQCLENAFLQPTQDVVPNCCWMEKSHGWFHRRRGCAHRFYSGIALVCLPMKDKGMFRPPGGHQVPYFNTSADVWLLRFSWSQNEILLLNASPWHFLKRCFSPSSKCINILSGQGQMLHPHCLSFLYFLVICFSSPF